MHRPGIRALQLLLPLALLTAAGCSVSDADERSHAGQSQEAEGDVGKWSSAGINDVKGVPMATLQSAIKQRLAGKRPSVVGEEAWQHTKRLYARFQQAPLWFDKGGLDKERVEALTNALLGATDDGLALDEYPIGDVAKAVGSVRDTKQPTAEQLADADVLLTAAYAALGEDLLIGQVNPKTVGQSWHIDARDENVDSALARTLTQMPLDKSMIAMRPADSGYVTLKKELARFREVVAKGGWEPIPAGKALKRGDSDSPVRLAALRARLAAEGIEVPEATTANATSDSTSVVTAASTSGDSAFTATRRRVRNVGVFDAGLASAVAEFQVRHGINVDSMLGTETLDALNVPAEYRLGQIAANLERYRWLPRNLGERYIYVNVPAFQLTAYDKGQPVLESKVIVGQEYEDKATPVFSDSMETVVFRPYWLITPAIQKKEVEPKVAANPGYLAANDMEYYKDGGQTRIRQRPGPKNALGYVKFLFPNDFNIYLHDTPNHELFDKDVRAFSHGCIRVEKPAELAQWVLGWDAGRVDEAMQAGKDNHAVRLPKKIPVYITYATTYVKDGKLYFGNDLYHRDDQLVKAVATGAVGSPAVKPGIESLRKIAGV
ncbi:MAG TPA: L,D-transpeptidase family protein [Gemmatimonadaceae bacterium]